MFNSLLLFETSIQQHISLCVCAWVVTAVELVTRVIAVCILVGKRFFLRASFFLVSCKKRHFSCKHCTFCVNCGLKHAVIKNCCFCDWTAPTFIFYIIHNDITSFFVDLFVHVLCVCTFVFVVPNRCNNNKLHNKRTKQCNWEGWIWLLSFAHITKIRNKQTKQSTHQMTSTKHAANHFCWLIHSQNIIKNQHYIVCCLSVLLSPKTKPKVSSWWMNECKFGILKNEISCWILILPDFCCCCHVLLFILVIVSN